MTDIYVMEVGIKTGDVDGAGTNGEVYFGICGREFHCDYNFDDDFERGDSRKYMFGDDPSAQYHSDAKKNDPRNPQLYLEDVDHFPVYIRFSQSDSDDHWNLAHAYVQLNGATTPQYAVGSFVEPLNLWLGKLSGAFCYLRKQGGGHDVIE
jgi:hypothetical protein